LNRFARLLAIGLFLGRCAYQFLLSLYALFAGLFAWVCFTAPDALTRSLGISLSVPDGLYVLVGGAFALAAVALSNNALSLNPLSSYYRAAFGANGSPSATS
jgi:hypothetical protein